MIGTPLLTPHQLLMESSATLSQIDFVDQSRKTIQSILSGSDPRILLIVGPCSIHDIASSLDFAEKFRKLAAEVSDTFFMIMRVHYEKPRTSLGWKGFLYDPHLDGSYDMNSGIRWTRQLLLDLANLGIPAASEILEPLAAPYFQDLISWGCIGARTSSSQIHRQVASGLPFPIAFKNNTDGNINVAIDGVLSASTEHTYFGQNLYGQQVIIRTKGNPFGHVVLRGGHSEPNYHSEYVQRTKQKLSEMGLSQSLLIDCSHDNSRRNHKQQPLVFKSVIEQIRTGGGAIRGLVLESHLLPGNQPLAHPLEYGKSITDPCLGWDDTAQLILNAHIMLQLCAI